MKWISSLMKPYSNCLFFALYMWWRHGGYVIVRKSRNSKYYPHFIYTKNFKRFIHIGAVDDLIPGKGHMFGFMFKCYLRIDSFRSPGEINYRL